ncbi:MAG TPA: MFS transporter [Actinomycetota bacterium]
MISLGSRRWWALGALALALLAVGLDLTVLNLALPTLATDLHASNAQLQWFIDAYTLVLAAMLLPAGLLGDRYGRKKLLVGALALFGVASLGCAYATSAGGLIAARAVLGLGGAFLIPLSMAVLPVLFTAEERPKAIAVWVAANAVSWPIGPILGGWLLDNYWWGSVFLINVPVTVVGLIAVAVLLPESRSIHRPRLDITGVLISSAGLVGLTYGAIEAGQHGWGSPAAAASLIAGVLLLVVFILVQRRISQRPEGQPLIDLSLFRSASFTWGTTLATLVSFALFGVLFAVPQYFQAVGGTTAMGAGLRLLPIIGGLLVGSQVAERLARRAGAKVTVATGFVLLAAGLATGAASGVHSGYGFAATWVSIVGIGMGFTLPTSMDAALSALSPERSGTGSGVIQALRQVGGTIGVAVLGTVLSSAYHARLDLTGLPTQAASAVRDSVSAGVAVAHQLGSTPLLDSVRAAFAHGMDVMLLACGGIALLGIVLTLAFLPRRALVPAADAAATTSQSEPESEIVV